jgi:phenylpropionate dioxygenase-like ring-hydroxylating dioxygenase large terminal subunit
MAHIAGYRPGLVDLAAGQISRKIFVNDEIYQEELERVFARAWLFVGHESQIHNPGDFFVSSMGEESVILCRDRMGQVHVFLNSCRHRGMKVCRYDEGNAVVLTCPYHGWSYSTDGKLVGVPYFREAYHGSLDRSAWGLVEVAQLCCYKGSVWATWDPQAPPFLEYLGDFLPYIDLTLDAWDGSDRGTEILCGIQKWRVPCNWKFPAENFGGDAYHVHWSHGAAIATGFSVGSTASPASANRMVSPGLGHGLICIGPDAFGDAPLPEIQAYERDIRPEVERRLGPRAKLVNPIVGTLFPNFSMLRGTSRTLRVWQPRGPEKTEIWSWVVVDKAAPPGVKQAFRLSGVRGFSPAGTFEQDDMDNWQECTQTCRGPMARRVPVNTQMGLGHEHFDPALGAWVSDSGFSESNHRQFYRRWARLMTADNWAQAAS